MSSFTDSIEILTCDQFFTKNTYFYNHKFIKKYVLDLELETIKDLILLLKNNNSMTNQYILSYILRSIVLFQISLKFQNDYIVDSDPGFKLKMEDEYIIHTDYLNRLHLCAVFDGHSGSACVNFVKSVYINRLYSNTNFINYLSTDNPNDMKTALINIAIDIDKELITNKIIGGSTAITCIVTPNNIFFSNLGDSRAILFRKDGSYFATTDQKPILYEERIKKAGGFVKNNRVNGKLAIANCFGDIKFKSNENIQLDEQQVVASAEVTVFENSVDVMGIIVACDGIFDVYNNKELIYDSIAFSTHKNINVAKTILNTCISKKSYDNLTVCVSLKHGIKKLINKSKYTDNYLFLLCTLNKIVTVTQIRTKIELNKSRSVKVRPISTIENPIVLPISTIENPYAVPISTIENPIVLPISTIENPIVLSISTIENPIVLPISTIENPYVVPISTTDDIIIKQYL
jgi:serine/threonine protein phosphatase PrpC